MNLVVLIIPFIVYCVKMYVYKLNMRDKIRFICLWYCILTTTVPVFIYLIILFIVNICKPLRFQIINTTKFIIYPIIAVIS
jgi:fucose 4-O-acetylase-like acetyltransferase